MSYPSLNFALGETIDMLRDSVQSFVASEIAPRAAQIDIDNLFPADLWRKFGDMGLWASLSAKNTVALAWVTWRTWWPWKKSAAARLQLRCPTARTPTSASTRSTATAIMSRRPGTCPS